MQNREGRVCLYSLYTIFCSSPLTLSVERILIHEGILLGRGSGKAVAWPVTPRSSRDSGEQDGQERCWLVADWEAVSGAEEAPVEPGAVVRSDGQLRAEWAAHRPIDCTAGLHGLLGLLIYRWQARNPASRGAKQPDGRTTVRPATLHCKYLFYVPASAYSGAWKCCAAGAPSGMVAQSAQMQRFTSGA